MGGSAFLYPMGGEVVTALHSSVPAETFMSKLKDDNYILRTLNYNLISYGFAKNDAFHTFEINVRALAGGSIPKEIFQIAKLGTAEKMYDLSNFRVMSNIYAELAYGYSRKLSDIVSVGVRGKLLVGLYSANYNFRKFDVEMTEDVYRATIESDMLVTNKLVNLVPDDEGLIDFTSFASKGRSLGPTAGGLAVDLGIEIKPVENLTVSASILDLGGLFWYYGNAASTSSVITFDGFKNVQVDQINESGLKNLLDGVKDDFLSSMKPKKLNDFVRFYTVPFTANLGFKYRSEFYDRLTVGAAGSYVGYKGMPYWDARLFVAVNPLEWLDFTADVGYSTYGTVYGGALSLKLYNFRINAGLQNGVSGKIAYTSTKLNANSKTVTVGVTFDLK
ncbi:MAG: hypothetical protein J6Z27_04815 [Bacteroidales bacterium]|nr:hypothetical protein [Bacteroidales bacterium]